MGHKVKSRKLIVFVKNKLITIDTVMPILLEMKIKYNVSSDIVVFDKLAHDAIDKNVVLRDLVKYVGREVFITKGEKITALRRFYIVSGLFKVFLSLINGAKIIHFGHLNKWPLRVFALFFSKNSYQMQGNAYNFKYSSINRKAKQLLPVNYAGNNFIICSDDIETTAFYNITSKAKVYKVGETRTRKSWVRYINSKSDYYFNKYHSNVDISNGFIVFILGAIDAYEHKNKLFHSTIEVLSRVVFSVPIFLKPHAYTAMNTVEEAIEGLDSFHITYLHPSILASKARAFICNNFSNTLADAHKFGVTTVEYANYNPEALKLTNGKSTDEQYVDYFINNNEYEFEDVMSNIIDQEYKKSNFEGCSNNNALFKFLI